MVIDTLDPDKPPSLQDEPLSPFERDILAHWTRFYPTMVAGLTQPEEAVRAAAHRFEYLTAKALAENPTLHRMQAEDLFRDQLWNPLGPPPPTRDTDRPITS